MIDADTPWKVVCSRPAFESLRSDEGFHLLLALARAVNSLRFTHQAMFDSRGSDLPAAVRQRMNSFMYTGALLFEGIELSRRLGKYFRPLDEFNHFSQIHRDRDAQSLVAEILKPLRDQTVFHFDVAPLAAAVTQMDNQEFIFVRAHGRQSGNTYYDLADAAALHLVFGKSESAEEFEAQMLNRISRVTDLAVRFLSAADKLIVAALRSDGWQVVVGEPTSPSDRA